MDKIETLDTERTKADVRELTAEELSFVAGGEGTDRGGLVILRFPTTVNR